MGDYSRRTFDPVRSYSSVLLQQGRVLLDADWNEAESIRRYRDETEATDVIGRCGVPRDSGAFRLRPTPDGRDLGIAPGRIWVDGRLCELHASWHDAAAVAGAADRLAVAGLRVDGRPLAPGQWIEVEAESRPARWLRIVGIDEAARELELSGDVTPFFEPDAGPARFRRLTTYLTQPYLPAPPHGTVLAPDSPPMSPPASPPSSPPASPPEPPLDGLPGLALGDGPWLAYLEAWDQEVTALDDPSIREVALGGPDTTTRVRTVWQVRLLSVSADEDGVAACATPFPELDAEAAPTTGTLEARVRPGEEPTLCELPPETGYQRLENQLYRVEIHTGGDPAAGDAVSFKWSRDNAAVETAILELDGTRLSLADLGRDEVLGFAPGQWVEVVDDVSALTLGPNPLARIVSVNPEAVEVEVEPAPTAELAGRSGLKLRRWDQAGGDAGVAGLPVDGDWVHLEGNIQVRFRPGRFHPGDHWLIPARTATGDIEWPRHEPETGEAQPLALPPRGIHRYRCRLAVFDVLTGAIDADPDDCRPTFPPLTDITAVDVGYDPTLCDLPGVSTVQEALDALCVARDLRHHNKYLHGAGVVCGLKVECSDDRTRVVIGEGYALDCEGYDLLVGAEGLSVDVVREATAAGLLDENGNGEACLGLHRDGLGGIRVTVESSPEQTFWERILEDTLLGDFIDECIQSPLAFLGAQLLPIPATAVPVPASQKRLISFLNLLWQLVNPTSGRYVFLSATGVDVEDAGPSRFSEHEFLYRFYLDLQDILSTGTFCGMFDDHPPYPAYPYAAPPAIRTAFGLFAFHLRMRLHPREPLAYTLGTGRFIHVYDRSTAEMVERLEFPTGGDLRVVDIAPAAEGGRVYAVGLLNQKDAVLAVATRQDDGSHRWGETTVICDTEIVSLATTSRHPANLYATGRGRGLFVFADPENIPVEPTPAVAFNATGLLALSPDGATAYAAESLTPGEEQSYEQVRSIDLSDLNAAPATFPATGTDAENDMVVTGQDLHVTVDTGTEKVLRSVARSGAGGSDDTPLGTSGVVRLGYVPAMDTVLISVADRSELMILEGESRELDAERRLPVQIFPTDVGVAENDGAPQAVVLNVISNTLSVVDLAEALDPDEPPAYLFEPPLSLSNYRQDVLDAYTALTAELLQYLKDCFCDQILIDCPSCDEEESVGIGCVEIRGNQVYRICNLDNRRFVNRSANWEYWLSAIPVLPVVKHGVREFCCTVFDAVGKRSTGARFGVTNF